MKYTEHQLDRMVDDLNDERKDRELEEKRAPVQVKPAAPPPLVRRKSNWPFLEQRPTA